MMLPGGPTPAVGCARRPRICAGPRSTSPLPHRAPPLAGDAAFHCQQASEKALKAFLAWRDVPFRKTHDLAVIGQQCVALDATLEPVCRRAERLTAFAWIFRYPGDAEEPPAVEIAEALGLAHEVYGAVLARLPAELRP